MKKQLLTIIGVLLAAMLLLPIDPSRTWEPLRLFTTSGFHPYANSSELDKAEFSLFILQTVFVCLLAVFIVNVPWWWRGVLLSLIAVAALIGVVRGVLHTISLRTAAREEERRAAARAEIDARRAAARAKIYAWMDARRAKGIPFDSDDAGAYLAANGTPEQLDAWIAKHKQSAPNPVDATPTP
jgi:hypothetical protein